jgi:hypothetical protein
LVKRTRDVITEKLCAYQKLPPAMIVKTSRRGFVYIVKVNELKSFEALCENWRTLAEAECPRRQSLPR